MSFNVRYASAGDGSNAWENADQLPERRDVVMGMIADKVPHIIGFQESQNNDDYKIFTGSLTNNGIAGNFKL